MVAVWFGPTLGGKLTEGQLQRTTRLNAPTKSGMTT
jgi:hypothetical protein